MDRLGSGKEVVPACQVKNRGAVSLSYAYEAIGLLIRLIKSIEIQYGF